MASYKFGYFLCLTQCFGTTQFTCQAKLIGELQYKIQKMTFKENNPPQKLDCFLMKTKALIFIQSFSHYNLTVPKKINGLLHKKLCIINNTNKDSRGAISFLNAKTSINWTDFQKSQSFLTK